MLQFHKCRHGVFTDRPNHVTVNGVKGPKFWPQNATGAGENLWGRTIFGLNFGKI
jgi:hypothetical protein